LIKALRRRCATCCRVIRCPPHCEGGWSTLTNGEVLAAAEGQGFEVKVTTDTNLKDQQNLASRSIAIVVLGTTSWPRIRAAAEAVVNAVSAAAPGTYTEVIIA